MSQGSLSQSRGRSVVSSGTSSRSKAPSRTQSKAQTEVEMALSEGDDEFLQIYVTEPEEAVVKGMKPSVSPIRAPAQSPPPFQVPSPVPSLQSGQTDSPTRRGSRGGCGWDGCGSLQTNR